MSTLKTIKLQNPSGASSNIDLGVGGEVLIGSASTTGTASQTLQVTGGAYVSGNLGLGVTSPSYKLDVSGSGTQTIRAITTDTSGFAISRFVSEYTGGGGGTNTKVELRAGDAYSYLVTTTNHPILFGTNETERARITSNASGGFFKASNTGTYYSSSGPYHEVVSNVNDANFISQNTNASLQGALLFATASRAANAEYAFLRGYSSVTADLEINIRGDGSVLSDGSYSGTGADYAEMFEWSDGNINNEDRVGYTVSLVGNKIKIAEEGDEVIGVISGNPSVLGDTAWNKWTEKYLKDEFNRYIFEEHNVVEWTDEDGKNHSYEDWNLPEDITVPTDATIKTHDDKGNRFVHRKVNPEYNPDQEYISREDRPEWDAVGLVGKLRVRKGQVIGDRWIKMQDISENVEEWLVR